MTSHFLSRHWESRLERRRTSKEHLYTRLLSCLQKAMAHPKANGYTPRGSRGTYTNLMRRDGFTAEQQAEVWEAWKDMLRDEHLKSYYANRDERKDKHHYAELERTRNLDYLPGERRTGPCRRQRHRTFRWQRLCVGVPTFLPPKIPAKGQAISCWGNRATPA